MKYIEVFTATYEGNRSQYKIRLNENGEAEFFDVKNQDSYELREFPTIGFWPPALKEPVPMKDGKRFMEALLKYYNGSYFFTVEKESLDSKINRIAQKILKTFGL